MADNDGQKQFWRAEVALDPVEGENNMINLSELTEDSILRNLELRYEPHIQTGQFNIYTYVGTILVSVNPYRPMLIYGQAYVNHYRKKRIGELPPHVFALADTAYRAVFDTQRDQCCIISGESGAGKTETAKHFLGYLAAMSAKISNPESRIEAKVLQTDTILEAFGCAVTMRNDNSSRFGKYFDVQLGANGLISGACVETYMLETSRVTTHAKNERNYHVFYQLLVGCSLAERTDLMLGNHSQKHFSYLGDSKAHENIDDKEEWHRLKEAMDTLLFTHEDTLNLMGALTAILHLGNINIALKAKSTKQGEVAMLAENDGSLHAAHVLLGIPKVDLREALLERSTFVKGEGVRTSLGVTAAKAIVDTLAKGVYDHVFTFVVSKVNKALGNISGEKGEGGSIGVLDIYGFEVFDRNSFEQLCINFWNERLQQYFVGHIFKMQQHLYEDEGIGWQEIKYVDNQRALDLLSEQPICIFNLIDDVVKLPELTDLDLLEKLNKNLSSHPDFVKARLEGEGWFGVQHFAGTVKYHVGGFIEKNRDTFSADLRNAVVQTTNPFVQTLFSDLNRNSTMTAKRVVSRAKKFRSSVLSLIRRINNCTPYFVRCIKPNEQKKPHFIDRPIVLRQLRYCGVLATIEIRKAGFPIQHSFEFFHKRYKLILKDVFGAYDALVGEGTLSSDRQLVKMVCTHYLGSSNESGWAMGKTLVFLKDNHDVTLESARSTKLEQVVLLLQRHLRGALARSLYQQHKESERVKREEETALIMQNTQQQHHQQQRYRERQHQRQHTSSLEGLSGLEGLTRQQLETLARRVSTQLADRQGDTRDVSAIAPHLERLRKQKKEIQQRRASMKELEEMTTLPSGIPFEEYARNHFYDPQSTSYSTSVPTAPVLAMSVEPSSSSSKPELVEIAVAARRLLLFYSGDIVLDGGILKPNSTRQFANSRSNSGAVLTATTKQKGPRLFSSFRKKSSKSEANDSLSPTPFSLALEGANAMATFETLGCVDGSVPQSNLAMAQIFIGLGIKHTDLRDELICHVMKQLLQNEIDISRERCWLMLALCLHCFSPSLELAKSIAHFIRAVTTPTVISVYALRQLVTWAHTAARVHPPGFLEFQTARAGLPMELQIETSDGSTSKCIIEARLRINMLTQRVCERLRLADSAGWGIFFQNTTNTNNANNANNDATNNNNNNNNNDDDDDDDGNNNNNNKDDTNISDNDTSNSNNNNTNNHTNTNNHNNINNNSNINNSNNNAIPMCVSGLYETVLDALTHFEQHGNTNNNNNANNTDDTNGNKEDLRSVNSSRHHKLNAFTSSSSSPSSSSSSPIVGSFKVFLLREYFPPWHVTQLDLTSSFLVFHQVVNALALRPLFKSHARTVDILARRYYVDFGPEFDYTLARRLLQRWLPHETLSDSGRPLDSWCTHVRRTLSTAVYAKRGADCDVVMVSVAQIARSTLKQMFSRSVVAHLHGDSSKGIPNGSVTIYMNHDGFLAVGTNTSQVVLQIPFYAMVVVEMRDRIYASTTIKTVVVTTFDAEYIFSGTGVVFILEFLQSTLARMRTLSRVGVVLRDVTEPAMLRCSKGDIVVFDTIGSKNNFSAVVQNLNTFETGEILCLDVFILASITSPAHMQDTFDKFDMITRSARAFPTAAILTSG